MNLNHRRLEVSVDRHALADRVRFERDDVHGDADLPQRVADHRGASFEDRVPAERQQREAGFDALLVLEPGILVTIARARSLRAARAPSPLKNS